MKKHKIPKFLKATLLLAWVAVCFYVAQYLVGIPMAFILRDKLSNPVWTTIYEALFYAITLFFTIFIPWKIFKTWSTNRTELGLRSLPTWTDIGLAIVGFVVYAILASLLIKIFSNFPFFDMNQAQETGYDIYIDGINRLIAFVALVIIAPIAEELIFRGWLYGKLRNTITGKLSIVLSMLLVSILFGILHGQWNVGVNVFAMSIVLCAMREITGTIYGGILLHILKNAVAFYIVFVMI